MNIKKSPYTGVRPFAFDEADIFFGRDEEINKLLFLIKNTSLITVVGPANCGKSSLLRAGVFPRLTGAWHLIEFSPVHKPYSQLAKALLTDPLLEPACQNYLANTLEVTESLSTQLRQQPQTIFHILQKTTLPPQTQILLFVDAFEAIFLEYQQSHTKEVEDFIDFLLEVTEFSVGGAAYPITGVIALRADFLSECSLFCNLAQRVEQGLFRIEYLSQKQLRLAIEKPAQRFGATVESALVEQLLNDLEREPAQVPLVQDALEQLWYVAQRENPEEVLLTLKHYQQVNLAFVPRRQQLTVVKSPTKHALTTATATVKMTLRKGELVLRFIPDSKTRKKVIAYLKHIAPKTTTADMIKLIAQPPVVLFKRISEQDAQIIVIELEKRGAQACFVPISSKSFKKSSTRRPTPAVMTSIQSVQSISVAEKSARGLLSTIVLSLFLLLLIGLGYFSWKNLWWDDLPTKIGEYTNNLLHRNNTTDAALPLATEGYSAAVGDWYRQVTERGEVGSESQQGLSQFQLGLAHEVGIGLRRDLERALYWYRQAAESGYRDAQYYLAWMYQEGDGVKQNLEKAVYWYQKAAEQGHISAHYFLGQLYDFKFKGNDREAAIWYRRAMELGHEQAHRQLTRLYQQGRIQPLTYDEIARWRVRAIEQGEPLAQFKLGRWYDEGEGVLQNKREAVRWYQLAAEQGDTHAQFFLAQSILQGQIFSKEHALRWYQQAAAQGHPAAQTYLGQLSDTATPPRLAEAVKWYYRAAEQGHTEAFYQLAKHYQEGQGVPQNQEIALQWYRKAARQQHSSAQLQLASQYLQGIGVKRDDKEAFKWYHLAAQQGHPEAQQHVGQLYQTGRGVEQDYQQAIVWYRQAADQNNGMAQLRLGEMYEVGQGVTIDKKKAVEWYRRAVHQGITEAQHYLAKLASNQ